MIRRWLGVIKEMAGAAAPRLRVLFVGNSFTARRSSTQRPSGRLTGVPDLLESIARARPESGGVACRALASDGATLEDHLDGGALAAALADGWTHVVLQENSERAAADEAGMRRDLHRIDGMVRRAGAATVLMPVWAGEGREAASRRAGAVCAEAGAGMTVVDLPRLWLRLRERRPGLRLCAGDGIHPSALGDYLAACALYSRLLGKPVSEMAAPMDVATVSELLDIAPAAEDLALLRAAAWDAALAQDVGIKRPIAGGDGAPREALRSAPRRGA
ncbi:MAG: hypothetical protein HY078_08765 [Elusimicrobia bacterium]|nr:hypothetical protein [Elusimicrobiota bacterium]